MRGLRGARHFHKEQRRLVGPISPRVSFERPALSIRALLLTPINPARPEGDGRFILSLRAVGEARSSLTFRSGSVAAMDRDGRSWHSRIHAEVKAGSRLRWG